MWDKVFSYKTKNFMHETNIPLWMIIYKKFILLIKNN